tara:strand:- start:386 stop:646 length:261 start_codon:yes stop_codon:yes gene_type:complete
MNPLLEQRKIMITGKKVLYEMIDELDDNPKSTMLGEYGALCVALFMIPFLTIVLFLATLTLVVGMWFQWLFHWIINPLKNRISWKK